jgi:hypothetical protein
MNPFTIFALILQLASAQSSATPLDRMRAKTALDPVTSLTAVQIAGQYANPSKELIKRVGPPLDGNNLYIFPDKTYVYCEWGDVMQNTVFDKGTWNFAEGVLALKSDPEIKWDTRLERRFLAVRRPSHSDEILLVGIEEELPYFEKKAGDDPELMLLIVAKQREEPLRQAEAGKLKTNLMREGWRPDFFRKQP